MRQIILDTETTGLNPSEGHRIIEIGAIELINRKFTGNHFHRYINPEREIDLGAQNVHGITLEFLKDKPNFSTIIHEFLDFIKNTELIIHNAPFDTGFINYELELFNPELGKIIQYCKIIDSLELARKLHPGQKNNLDALCKRYNVDNTKREYHGALLDAQLLGHVYLAMTGGQATLFGDGHHTEELVTTRKNRGSLTIIRATAEETALHEARLKELNKSA